MQKEKTQELLKENKRLLSTISTLKQRLKEVQTEYDQVMKYVKMLKSEMEHLDYLLSSGQSSTKRYGLGYNSSENCNSQKKSLKVVPATGETHIVKTEGTKTIALS